MDAIIEVILVNPYGVSLSMFEEVFLLKSGTKLRVIVAHTNSHLAKIAIPWIAFKRVFKTNPYPQNLPISSIFSKTVTSLKVIGINIIELPHAA